MTREVDRRDLSVNKVTDDREAALHALASEVSERLPGAHSLRIASFDSTTGNPAVVVSESPPADEGSFVARALDHVQRIGTVLGLAATQPPEYVADSTVQRTSSSAAAVHLQQCYKGIPIFQAAQAVRFAPDGTIEGTAGSTVSVAGDQAIAPGSRSRTPSSGPPNTSPRLTPTSRTRPISSTSRWTCPRWT